MLDDDLGAALAADPQGDIATQILAEIVEAPALGIFPAVDGRQRLQFAHAAGLVGDEARGVEGQYRAAGDCLQFVEPGVVDLAEIDAALQDRQQAALPGGVGCEQQRRIAAGAGAQLRNGGDPVAPGVVERRLLRPHHLRAVPAVGEPDVDDVLAGDEQIGNVVGLVGKPLVVGGPARRQEILAHPLAVDEGAIEPQGADMQPLAAADAVQGEAPAQEGCLRADAGIGERTDHLRRPADRVRMGSL